MSALAYLKLRRRLGAAALICLLITATPGVASANASESNASESNTSESNTGRSGPGRSSAESITRPYWAALGRAPDPGGYHYWNDAHGNGMPLAVELGLRPTYGVDVVGFATDQAADHTQPGLPQPVVRLQASNRAELEEELASAVRTTGANRLIIGPSGAVADGTAQAAARWGASHGLPVHVVPRLHEMGMGMDSMSPDVARGFPLVRLQRSAHPTLLLKAKRLMDITVAATGIIATAPIMAVAALAVKQSSPGPILYKQDRIGQHGRTIEVAKFRSMREEGDGTTEWTSDHRTTKVGEFLRRSSIDELPQLFSILRGDMSLVGPRPERPAFVEDFGAVVPNYHDRHRFPVGLTGLAQVAGLRGDTSIAERVKYDNLYIDQWSLWADFEILLGTVSAVLFQHKRSQQVTEVAEAVDRLRV